MTTYRRHTERVPISSLDGRVSTVTRSNWRLAAVILAPSGQNCIIVWEREVDE